MQNLLSSEVVLGLLMFIFLSQLSHDRHIVAVRNTQSPYKAMVSSIMINREPKSDKNLGT